MRRSEFERILPAGYGIAKSWHSGEIVYEYKTERAGVSVLVLSTVEWQTGVARPKDADAVRVLLACWDSAGKKWRPLEWEKKVLRVGEAEGIGKRVADRVARASFLSREWPLCEKCGFPLVTRKAKKTGRVFLGCVRYPECDGKERKKDGVEKAKSGEKSKNNGGCGENEEEKKREQDRRVGEIDEIRDRIVSVLAGGGVSTEDWERVAFAFRWFESTLLRLANRSDRERL